MISQLKLIPLKNLEDGTYPDFELLVYAIMMRRADLFEKILNKNNEDIDYYRVLDFSKETKSFTLLHLAVIEGYYEASKLLVESKKIDLDVSTKQGVTPLMIACKKGYFDLVKLLIENGAKVNNSSKTRNTPLMFAAATNSEANRNIVEYLIENGADLEAKNKKGNTALMSAALRSPEISKLLVKYGADPNMENNSGKKPMDYFQNSDEIMASKEA